VKRLTVLSIAVAVGLTACGGSTNTEGSAQQTKPLGNQPPEAHPTREGKPRPKQARPPSEAKSPPQEAKPTAKAEPRPEPEPEAANGESTSPVEERVGEAQRRLLAYCAEPSSRVETRKNSAISALVRIARKKPETGIGENSMADVLDETATLLADCDTDAARRLTRAARSLR
jgi:hypothetical protein